jgi:hypothetical protein
MAATRPVPAPARNDYIPLHLAALSPVPPASEAPEKAVAPEAPVATTPLFPEDSSLLGFVLGAPGKDARTPAATPPQPTRLAMAAQGLANFVRSRTAAPASEAALSTPGTRRETAHSAPRVALREEPEHAAIRKTQPAAGGRPPGRLAGSAVEQMQPLIPGLLASLDEAMDDVRRGFRRADAIAVEEGAARIAARADNYGLRVPARMARCVEMAAKAQDKDALANILPDLETAVERNRIALQPKT